MGEYERRGRGLLPRVCAGRKRDEGSTPTPCLYTEEFRASTDRRAATTLQFQVCIHEKALRKRFTPTRESEDRLHAEATTMEKRSSHTYLAVLPVDTRESAVI